MRLHTLLHPIVTADGGIISTLTSFNTDLFGFIKNVAVTVIVVFFLYQAHKKGWAMGAIFPLLIVAGLLFFFINGGLQWVGSLFNQQFDVSGS